ncbi:ARM repeat-containing protein [Westerdykella ornata]|uniref:ARM repeat-containing protein n=1 Tax=Westerdykella ornata TaxID=318751 RepID=A0A6A6JW89_WESOR|nr:ARM repeat-containing protein [Westerdykella ornata]KAF2280667.1 ARM repeat-containing protein [Westerdykella ornata]
MASQPTSEARELQLVGSVEFRIAAASTDRKLEQLLDKFLAPLLLKLASEHLAVRNKVISVCQHINKRILPPQEIKLPVRKLLVQFKEHSHVPLIRHFDILYIQQGIARLQVSERLELLPLLINGIASDYTQSPQHASQLFHLTLRLLAHFNLPPRGTKEDDELRSALQLTNDDGAFLSHWFGKLLLFGFVRSADSEGAPSPRCPGLSVDDYKFLTLYGNADAWDPRASTGLNILETKALVVKLLASGLFNDHERFLPALFASADTNTRVSEVGEDMLKRVTQTQDLEDQGLIERLFSLYFGSSTPEGALPVKVPLRIKILGLLSRSVRSTQYPKQISRMVEEGVLFVEQESSNRTTVGRQSSKFRSALFSFVNFVARHGSRDDLALVAEGLVGNLRGFIQDQGWPSPDRDQDQELRGYAYETIGLVAKAAPEKILIEPNLSLLDWLFRSLRHDTSGKEVAVSIEEALSSVLDAFSKPLEISVKSKFRQLLLKYSLSDKTGRSTEAYTVTRSTRYVATRFANRCLAYDDVWARWIDIAAVSGGKAERHEVVEEGKRGLDPYLFAMQHSIPGEEPFTVTFPAFDELVRTIFLRKTDDDVDMDGNFQPRMSTPVIVTLAKQFYKDYPEAVPVVMKYCTQVCIQTALSEKSIIYEPSEDWGRKLESLLSTDQLSRQALRSFASDPHHAASIAILLRTGFELLTHDDVTNLNDVGDDFIRLLSLSTETSWMLASLTSDAQALVPSILANNVVRRNIAAHSYGLLASHGTANPEAILELHQTFFEKLSTWRTAVGGEINQLSGVVVALGYYFSRLRWRQQSELPADHAVHQFVQQVIDILHTTRDVTLQAAVFSCLDQLSLHFVITPSTLSQYGTFREVAQKIYDQAKTGMGDAITCLGHLGMITLETDSESTDTSDYSFIAEKIYELHEVRHVEAQFSIGEALSCFAAGWGSKALAAQLDIEHPAQQHAPWDAPLLTPSGPKREKTLTAVLERTLKGCHQSKPSLKKASVIWLLCLLQYCGHIPDMQGYLGRCQGAFKACLSNRDEVVQEAASRGLGLVYEKGDRHLKDELVRDLVGSFSDNKSKMAGTVTEDTQLFEPGALPVGEGKSITTYKDILSLASEVGDSSLVYRFMSLASNSSIWSSRAAFGRFGLSNIFADSSVRGYLAENPKLYPKLFRYRFDPNPNVGRAMNDIWNALVKDPSATIDKHFDAIMEDLLSSILTKEWRVRQASCAAIAELVQGRKLEKYEKYLDQIWDKCFKVLDDIKETVRVAAASLARVLTGILTRSLEAGDSSIKNAGAMLSRVLPFLLSSSGLESSAEEVRIFAVHTLLEIVKKSNAKTLNPHSPELVERLLGLLSSLEPEAVNYIHLNASKYNLTEQKIDDMRLQSVRSSPLTESIERCLDLADADTMEKLVLHIESAMRDAVGLPSKVGCSRILVILSTRHNYLFRPYADGFLKLIHKYIHDRNETVSSSYAAAAGYVARLASDNQLISTIAYCQDLYFASGDDRSRLTAADIIHSISKNATDRFTALSADLLPFIFVAKHDSQPQVQKIFADTWSDNVAGSRTVLLYLKEIVALANRHLDSQKWVLKHAAAKATAGAVMSITTGKDEIDKANAETLWPALDKAIGGKTWVGKEIVLEAFVRFVERGTALWSIDSGVAEQIEKVAVREAKRVNKTYRPYAVDALGKIAKARVDLVLAGNVMEVVKGVVEEVLGDGEEENGERMEVDAGEVLRDEQLRDQTLSACVSSLLSSLHPLLTSSSFSSAFGDTLPLILRANSIHAKNIHLTTFTSLHALFLAAASDLSLAIEPEAKAAFEKILFDPTYEGLPETMRVTRAQALIAIGRIRGCKWAAERAAEEMNGERSLVVKGVLAQALLE